MSLTNAYTMEYVRPLDIGKNLNDRFLNVYVYIYTYIWKNLSIGIMFRSCANHCPHEKCTIAIPKKDRKGTSQSEILVYSDHLLVYVIFFWGSYYRDAI